MQPTRQMRLYKRRIYRRSICPIHVHHPLYDVQPRVLIGFAARVWYFSLFLFFSLSFFIRIPLFHSSEGEWRGWRERGDLGYWPVYPAWRRSVPPWRSMDEFDSAWTRFDFDQEWGEGERMIKFLKTLLKLFSIRGILIRFTRLDFEYITSGVTLFILWMVEWFAPEERWIELNLLEMTWKKGKLGFRSFLDSILFY